MSGADDPFDDSFGDPFGDPFGDSLGDPFDGDDTAPIVALIGVRVAQVGDAVRLRPSARADAFDLLLDGMTARIEQIRQDYENRIYLVVALDDDPGREQTDERVLPGHRFFFFCDEVELLDAPANSTADDSAEDVS